MSNRESKILPAVVLGFLVYFFLEDKPSDAKWLSSDEKELIVDRLQHDVKDVESEPAGTFGQMLRDPKVYVLSLVYFLLLGATYTMVFWLPTLIQSWGVKDLFLIGAAEQCPFRVKIESLDLSARCLLRGDLSPEVHPAMGGILCSFEPVRLGDATGRGAEPSTQRSVPSCCIADAVSLA
jgi:hypothetical protein